MKVCHVGTLIVWTAANGGRCFLYDFLSCPEIHQFQVLVRCRVVEICGSDVPVSDLFLVENVYGVDCLLEEVVGG